MVLQVLLLSLLFTGYLVNIAAVTPVLQWVHYLSVFFFGFESLIVNEMSGISLIFSVSISRSSDIPDKCPNRHGLSDLGGGSAKKRSSSLPLTSLRIAGELCPIAADLLRTSCSPPQLGHAFEYRGRSRTSDECRSHAQAAGASITIKGDLFLQLISVRTDMLIRDVAVLDAYFFAFVIAGIALLYLTMPRALVVRRCDPYL